MTWIDWHDAYDDPSSALSERLRAVRRRLGDALDQQSPGPVRIISMCAGDGRDVISVLADHPRRADVRVRLVEAEPVLVDRARHVAARLDASEADVVQGDAGRVDAYIGAVPADVVLACGVFGNVTGLDIAQTVAVIPSLCAPGARVIWTRGGGLGPLDEVDRLFSAAGFELIGMEVGAGDHRPWGVGVHRLVERPATMEPGTRLFEFIPSRRPVIAS